MQLTESFDVKDELIARFATTGTTRACDGHVSRLDNFQSTTAAFNNTDRITLAFHDRRRADNMVLNRDAGSELTRAHFMPVAHAVFVAR